MNSQGKHRMIKVCILESETVILLKQNGYLSFGMEKNELCQNKTDTFVDLEVKAKKYFKDSGFDKYSNTN